MLKDTLSKFFKVDSLLSNLTGYVETRVELLKIEVKEDVAKGLAQAVSYLFIAFVVALFVTFISVALALLLGQRLGNIAGFSIVALIYLIVGVILWSSREKLIARLENKLSLLLKKKK
jgi:uncharacterized membrane protein YqjE